MSRRFPMRINRHEAAQQFNYNAKKPDADIKIFAKGARHYLHPSLIVLDMIDCELIYYRQYKIMVMSFDPIEESIDNTDYTKKTYRRAVMSPDVKFISDSVYEHIQDSKKIIGSMSSAINSDDSETLDIKTEEYSQ